MNKLKTALLILFAVVIVILIFFLVKNANNSNNTVGTNKMLSEIKYMDNKLTSLINSVNNISLENYKISVTKTSTNSNAESSSKEQKSQSGEAEQKSSGSSDGEQTESSNSSSNSNSTDTSAPEQYELQEKGILTGDSQIDWDTLKNEVEILYSIVPTITLDLYSANAKQEEILSFNKELDELTTAVKGEDKEETLTKLANLYRYLPVYASNISDDSEYISLLETKSNVFNSYVFANASNWEEASNYVRRAIESYSSILNNIEREGNSYNPNKVYIILNELQNATDMQDLDIFLIKYKTFLEETEKKQ